MAGERIPSILDGRARIIVVVVLGAVVSLGGVLALRGCPPPEGVGPSELAPTVPSLPTAPPMVHEGVSLRGLVRVEDSPRPPPDPSAPTPAEGMTGATTGATTEATTGATGATTGTSAEATGEGSTSADTTGTTSDPGTSGEPELGVLRSPRSCTVIAWSAGRQLGAPVRCDSDGSYELELERAPATVAVEILVPGYLRGMLEAEPVSGAEVDLPTVALGPAVHLSGQVIDPRGQPVSDVQLRARPRPDLGEPEPWRVTSDGDGSFRWDTLPTGPVEIEAEKRGYAPTIVDVVAPEDGIVVVLEGLRDLNGEVLGTPEQLARTRVRIEGSSIWPPIVVPVAADGSFVIPQIADGVYGLVAEAPANVPGEPEYASIPLENVSPDMQVSLALIEAVRVPVEVRDPNGLAIRGARVTVSGSSVGILQQIAESDDAGLAQAGPLVPGPYLVHADADGYLPSETVAVDAQIDVPMPPIELRLIKPGRVLGQVIDEHGQAVAEARVTIESDVLYSPGESMVRAGILNALVSGGTLGVTRGTVPPIPLFDEASAGPWIEGGLLTDGDGRFSMGALVPGTYRLRAVHERHAASAVQVVRLRAGELMDDVVLVLQRGQALTGRFVDTNGQPVIGARIEFDDGLVVLTDELGTFDAGLHKGRRRLVVRAPGMIPQAIEVEVGERPVDLERTLAPAAGAVEGRLRDRHGRPVVGARVALFSDDGISPTVVTYTDDRGLFELDRLTPGGAEIEVDHPNFAPYERRMRVPPRADGRLLEIGLSAGWLLAVHVRASGSGDPIAGAKVRVGDQVTATDAAGDALVRRLARARVDVTIEAEGWVRERSSVARPEDDEGDLVVDLEEGAAIEGSIQDERGEPVVKAQISIRDRRSGELVAETESDADGVWRVDRLSEGDVIVEATPPGDLSEILAPVSENSDVLRGRVTRGVALRFDRL